MKPTSYPEWAIQYRTELRPVNGVERELPNRAEPFQEWKNTGVLWHQNLPREYLNWQFWNIGEWIKYFDSSLNPSPEPITEDGELVVGAYMLVDSSGGTVTLEVPAGISYGNRFLVANYGGTCIIDGDANGISLFDTDGVTPISGDTITLANGQSIELVAIGASEVKKVVFGQLGSAAFRNTTDFINTFSTDQVVGGFDSDEDTSLIEWRPSDYGTGKFAFGLFKEVQPDEYTFYVTDGLSSGTLNFNCVVKVQGSTVWTGANAATTLDMYDNAATGGVTPSAIYTANAEVDAGSGSGSFTLDFKGGRNFKRTLTGASTMANPDNKVSGQEGKIFIEQDASGGHTLSFGTDFKLLGGTATIDLTPNAVNVFAYYVRANGNIVLSYAGVAS